MIDVKNIALSYKIDSANVKTLKEFIVRFFEGKMKYSKLDVLKDISFHINKGEVVGIIGKNGAGKSTLLKIITGILQPTGGKVKVNGSIIPMLELGCGFDQELTGIENIYLNGAILGFTKEYINQKYNDIVEFSELGDFIKEPIRTYSSGMLMRLGFSIAVMCNPDVLIVDEILAVGDDKFQQKSYNKMMELMHQGTTVLLVSHSIDVIKSLCNKVIWIEDGFIKMEGDPEQVCTAYSNRE